MLRYLFVSFFICLYCWGQNQLQEGVILFQEKSYDKALIAFTRDDVSEQQPVAALIGRLFCQIALGQLNEIDTTITLVDEKIKDLNKCTSDPKTTPQTSEEHHASYLCRRKVREVANEMRQTVEQLVRETVPGVFQKIKALRQLYPFIDSLERVGIDCCQNNGAWRCCLSPLLEQLEAWDQFGTTPPFSSFMSPVFKTKTQN